jgi:D-alanyl-D-alanine carboxypeptidase/D-alanyl-D-alanine-endopeptidase (penicillin-binding protein 4)
MLRKRKKTYKQSPAFIIQYLTFIIIVLSSCSLSKQINRSAQQLVKDSSLTNAHLGISIYEPASGQYWYNYNGDKYFVPASNTKIPTCYAAMKYLGDSLVGLRYVEDAYSNIYIKPSGDPTFLHPDFKNHPVYNYLSDPKKAINVLRPYEENFRYPYGSGWQIDDVSEIYQVPRSEFPVYGNLVTFSVDEAGKISSIPKIFSAEANLVVTSESCPGFKSVRKFDVFENRYLIECSGLGKSSKTIQAPFRPTSGLVYIEILGDTIHKKVYTGVFSSHTDFKAIYSQPTDSLLKPMMHRSDNFFAEQSLLMVSNEMLGVMNDEKIIDTLLKTDFKDLPQKPRWADGSGLSRYNLFTPQDFVAILGKMKNEFGMNRIKEIFPTGGEGTITSYYKADSGYIYAKTGTLSGVVALSGFLTTKKNKAFIFSVLVNNHQGSATAVRKAVEKFIQYIRNNY